MRDSIVFYRSFYEAITELPEQDQLAAIKAILEYGLNGLEAASGTAKSMLIMARPIIDANNKRYENGKKGGRPPKNKTEQQAVDKQVETESKPKDNLTQTDSKPYVNVDVYVNDNNKITAREVDRVFEEAWSMYPEKKGKGRVSDKDKRKIAEIGIDHFARALERYKAEIRGSSFKHYQNGSTFFHSGYIDYLDENYTPSTEIRGNTKTTRFNNATERDRNMGEIEKMLIATS